MKETQCFDESYFNSASWLDYIQLWEERPELFTQNDLLKLCSDRNTVLRFMNRTGTAIGVLYKSSYSIMVVDLVLSADGKMFSYERLLPATADEAVVTVPVCGNQFVLLKQFRHSLRRELITFPRGFGEKNLSAVENAKKELYEETGAAVTETRLIGHIEPDSGMIGNSAAVIFCKVDNVNLKSGYEGIKQLLLLNEDELEELIRNGEITDGYTLAAFALLKAEQSGNRPLSSD
jgi:ADP-ribose pyrophosphatase